MLPVKPLIRPLVIKPPGACADEAGGSSDPDSVGPREADESSTDDGFNDDGSGRAVGSRLRGALRRLLSAPQRTGTKASPAPSSWRAGTPTQQPSPQLQGVPTLRSSRRQARLRQQVGGGGFSASFKTMLSGSEFQGFVPIYLLGCGSSGMAQLMHNGERYVVSKQMAVEKMRKPELVMVQGEVLALRDLSKRSKHIVQYLGCVFSGGMLCLVMEYAEAGTLERLIEMQLETKTALSRTAVHVWLYQLASALQIVHEAHIMHRDIKTSNILLMAAGDIKLADFGLAKRIDEAAMMSFAAQTHCGTLMYLAPERARGERYSKASDAWAVGVVLYEMLTLRHPFDTKLQDNVAALIRSIQAGDVASEPLAASGHPTELTALASSAHLLHADPSQRMTMSALMEYLRTHAGASGLTPPQLWGHEDCRSAVAAAVEESEALLRCQFEKAASSERHADGTEVAPVLAPLQSIAIERIDEECAACTSEGEAATGSGTQSAVQGSTESSPPPTTASSGHSSNDDSGSCEAAATGARSGSGSAPSSSSGANAEATTSNPTSKSDSPITTDSPNDTLDSSDDEGEAGATMAAAVHPFSQSFYSMLARSPYSSFESILVLGKGAQALAVLMQKGEQRVVGKTTLIENADAELLTMVQREVLLLKSLSNRSRHIIQYLDCYVDGSAFTLVLGYADAGTLGRLLQRQVAKGRMISTAAIHVWLYQLASALQIVHNARILHRDVKTANILLCSNGDAKLSDFGLAKRVETGAFLAQTRVGTPFYCSPELVSGAVYGSPSDVWALGVVAYEMLTLQKPFFADEARELFQRIKFEEVDFGPLLGTGRDHLAVLPSQMLLLQHNPEERMTLPSMLEYLREHAEASGLDASRLDEPHAACRDAVRRMAEHAEAKVQMAMEKRRRPDV